MPSISPGYDANKARAHNTAFPVGVRPPLQRGIRADPDSALAPWLSAVVALQASATATAIAKMIPWLDKTIDGIAHSDRQGESPANRQLSPRRQPRWFDSEKFVHR